MELIFYGTPETLKNSDEEEAMNKEHKNKAQTTLKETVQEKVESFDDTINEFKDQMIIENEKCMLKCAQETCSMRIIISKMNHDDVCERKRNFVKIEDMKLMSTCEMSSIFLEDN